MQHHTVTAELSRLRRAELMGAAHHHDRRALARRAVGQRARRARWPALLVPGRSRRPMRPASAC